GRPVRVPRPQGQEAELPGSLDPAHQRRGPRRRPDLFAVHARREAGRHRTRPQGHGRSRDERRWRVHRDHRAGEGGAAQGSLTLSASKEIKGGPAAGPPFFVGASASGRRPTYLSLASGLDPWSILAARKEWILDQVRDDECLRPTG